MQNNELIERYIYAVTKHMMPKIKQDVADELNSIIYDMLEERCGDVNPTERDIRGVLAKLGTPRELSQKYDEDSDKCLIGAPYYANYKYILKIVSLCVIFGMSVAIIIGSVMNQEVWYVIFVKVLSGITSGLLSAFAFVTILFAVFYHKGIKMDNLYDTIDNLPPIPKNTNIIPRREPIWGIGISVIFTIVFLCCPQIVFVWFEGMGTTVAVFNIDYIRTTWYLVLIFSLLGIVRECAKLIDGTYTKRLVIVTIVTDILTGIISCIWLTNKNILNPDFQTAMIMLFEGDGAFIGSSLSEFNYIFLAIILFALLLDMATTIYRTIKNQL